MAEKMKPEKKVVDLIYIKRQKNNLEIINDYNFLVNHWKELLKKIQEIYFERHFDSSAPDVLEILGMRQFLGKFLQSRLDWVANEVKDEKLKARYLNVLPPFPQKGGIKTLLLHFYQIIETGNAKGIQYKAKNDVEKEISILWDIYKLRRTIESIETIKTSLSAPDCFPSIFSIDKRKICLDSLKQAFQLMFQMCVQKEYQRELYNATSADYIKPELILERQEDGRTYVYPHVIKKYDYKNHFFYIYFNSGMKAKIAGKIKEFRYNFLDLKSSNRSF